MIKLNKEQSKWIANNFGLSSRDLPTHFYGPFDLIKMLTGDYAFWGDSFVSICLGSLYSNSAENISRFERLFVQFCFLEPKAKELEYYELLSNLNEMNNHFITFTNEANATQHTKNLLRELGIKTQ